MTLFFLKKKGREGFKSASESYGGGPTARLNEIRMVLPKGEKEEDSKIARRATGQPPGREGAVKIDEESGGG